MIRHNLLDNTASAEQFFRGVRLLKDPRLFPAPDPSRMGPSMYDFFIFWHHRAMMTPTPVSGSSGGRNAAHSGPAFLPWHRYMLLMLEFHMRNALNDESFRLPYWDWAADAQLLRPENAPIWDNEFLGQFIDDNWSVWLEDNPFNNGLRVRSRARPLVRNFDNQFGLPERSEIQSIVNNTRLYDTEPYNTDSLSFRNQVEGWRDSRGRPGPSMHNRVHAWIGGDMGQATSPNDPAFFLHHCNVDRIWAAWQQKHPNADYRPDQTAPDELLFHRIDDRMHTFFDHGNTTVTPRLMLDYQGWYQYDRLDDLS